MRLLKKLNPGIFKMKYYIIAGEPSGDIYGSRLIQEIIKTNPNSEIRFWGGDLMKKSGGMLVKHCLLYTSPSPRDVEESRMPSSA